MNNIIAQRCLLLQFALGKMIAKAQLAIAKAPNTAPASYGSTEPPLRFQVIIIWSDLAIISGLTGTAVRAQLRRRWRAMLLEVATHGPLCQIHVSEMFSGPLPRPSRGRSALRGRCVQNITPLQAARE